MTKFRSKILWYWDFIDCNMKTVLIFRCYNNPWKITLYFGTNESIELSSLGEVIYNTKTSYQSHECNSQSWNQYLSRYFPKTRYTKSGELYVYDTPDDKE